MSRDSRNAKTWIPVRRLIGAGYSHVCGDEPRAADHVDAVSGHRVLEAAQLGRVVLAVTVDLGHPLVAVVVGKDEARLHRTADAEVERQPDDLGAGLLGEHRSRVGRPVIDNEDVELRRLPVKGGHHVGDGGRFVVGGDDGEAAEVSHGAVHVNGRLAQELRSEQRSASG